MRTNNSNENRFAECLQKNRKIMEKRYPILTIIFEHTYSFYIATSIMPFRLLACIKNSILTVGSVYHREAEFTKRYNVH